MRVTLYRCKHCGEVSTVESWDCCPTRIYAPTDCIEPIVFAPLPSERARKWTRDAMKFYNDEFYSEDQGGCAEALTEIEKCWEEEK